MMPRSVCEQKRLCLPTAGRAGRSGRLRRQVCARRRCGAPRTGAARAGFTLFEVLLAMGVSSLLLAAMYTALNLHFSRVTHGYADLEHAAVGRGLLRKIGLDLRSALYSAPSPSSSDQNQSSDSSNNSTSSGSDANTGVGTSANATSGSSASSGTASDETGSGSTGSSESQLPVRELGLWGESDWILLDVGVPPGHFRRRAAAAAQDEESPDLYMVLYMLARRSADENQAAMVRVEVPRRRAEESFFDLQTLLESAAESREIISEVTEFQFRYFDGTRWSESWDSSTFRALPRAVEVMISVKHQDAERKVAPLQTVIALPTPTANRVHDDYQQSKAEEGT